MNESNISAPYSIFDASADIYSLNRNIREEACKKWLPLETIEKILLDYKAFGFTEQLTPPLNIQNGQLFIFDRNNTKQYKVDGINWVKKKGRDRIQETYQIIKIDGIEKLHGIYCRSADNTNFQKRIYRILEGNSPISLVHYRDIGITSGESHVTDHSKLQSNLLESRLLKNHYPAKVTTELNPTPSLSNQDLYEALFAKHAKAKRSHSEIIQNQLQPQYDKTMRDQKQSFELDEHIRHDTTNQSFSGPGFTKILDFAPACHTIEGGEKLLLCLAGPLPSALSVPNILLIDFGHSRVTAEILSSNVLRCYIPPCVSSQRLFRLSVVTDQGESITQPTDTLFRYHDFNTSSIQPSLSLDSLSHNIPNHIDQSSHSRHSDQYESFTDENDRKVRLVELNISHHELMNDLNQSIAMNQNTTSTRNHSNEEKSNSHENEPNSITDHDQADGWLDDVELGNLSPNDFDNVMDQYLTTVIRQLVHLAIDDADLNQELNSLDSNGFSLLHYCCLYNLTDLISLLLNNGAHINQLTACGSSPLHLAVGANHLSTVKLLVEAHADTENEDAYSRTPLQLAFDLPHNDAMIDYLTEACHYHQVNEDTAHQNGFGCAVEERKVYSMESHSPPTSKSDPINGVCTTDIETNRKEFLQMSFLMSGFRQLERFQRDTLIKKAENEPLDSTKNETVQPLLSHKLLHGAFSSLSLTDKCALAISITKQHKMIEQQAQDRSKSSLAKNTSTSSIHAQTSVPNPDLEKDSRMEAVDDDLSVQSTSVSEISISSVPKPPTVDSAYDHGYTTSKVRRLSSASQKSDCGLATSEVKNTIHDDMMIRYDAKEKDNGDNDMNDDNDDDEEEDGDEYDSSGLEFDVRSVLTEEDRESLDVVMRMMGELELSQVENEVRVIQNNVRGWLLRKNYINLRSAAKKLQVAWREYKKTDHKLSSGVGHIPLPKIDEHSVEYHEADAVTAKPTENHTITIDMQRLHNLFDYPMDINDPQKSSSMNTMTVTNEGVIQDDHRYTRHDDSSIIESKEYFDGKITDSHADVLNIHENMFESIDFNDIDFDVMNSPTRFSDNSSLLSGILMEEISPKYSDNDLLIPSLPMEIQDDIVRTNLNPPMDSKNHSDELNTKLQKDVMAAAAKVQAATRGMLARRSFTNLRKQAMASLVIQKSLRQWWSTGKPKK